jgi:hypothetical protein
VEGCLHLYVDSRVSAPLPCLWYGMHMSVSLVCVVWTHPRPGGLRWESSMHDAQAAKTHMGGACRTAHAASYGIYFSSAAPLASCPCPDIQSAVWCGSRTAALGMCGSLLCLLLAGLGGCRLVGWVGCGVLMGGRGTLPARQTLQLHCRA